MTIEAEYKISLLGSFQVFTGDQKPVQFVADSSRALLAYLAASPDVPHSRESLASLIWPDHNRSSGFNNLRQALKRLKDSVGDDVTETPLVLTEKKTIQINPEAKLWVDVQSFEEAILNAQQARIEDSIPFFEDALYLYRGEFLNDFHIKSYPFEEWMSSNQTKYREKVLLALSKMSAFYFQRSEFDVVVQYSRRMMELEPWYEEAHRQLIIAMAMNNQRNRALAEYRRYHHALKRHLDIEPEIETIDIYHRIRSGEIGRNRTTARTPRFNFPSSTTSFLGRHDELRVIQQEIANPDHRLITLVGSGGVGKTRLALNVANLVGNDYTNGVVFVPMEILNKADKQQKGIVIDENYISTILADALGLKLFGDQSPKEQILEYLKTLNMLLVFDNFEDVIETAPLFIEILQHSPDVTLLVTSRENLNLQAESVLRIEGFIVPSGSDIPLLESFHSIQLFIERANRFPIDFDLNQFMDSIIEICRLVDGMPLGIELASNLIERMTPPQIRESIQKDIDILTSTMHDIPERHRSIRAVFESSWRFLSKEEQTVYSRLSVFNGGFEIDAGVQVAKADTETIKSLRDKSLLIEVGAERFAMHKVLHQLAEEKLKRGKTTRRLHSKYYLDLLIVKEKDFGGSQTRQIIERLFPDLANIRRAWLWASANLQFNNLDKSLNSLFDLYSLRGLHYEGQALSEDALRNLNSKNSKKDPPPHSHSRLLVSLGWFLLGQGDLENAMQVSKTAVDLAKKGGFGKPLAEACLVIGKVNMNRGRWNEAILASESALSLARQKKFKNIEVQALLQIGLIQSARVQYSEAQTTYQSALKLLEKIQNFPQEVDLLNAMGGTEFQLGQYDQALAHYEQALEVNQEAGNHRMDGILWNNYADIMVRLGDFQTALVYYAKSQQNSLIIADRINQAMALQALAQVSLLLGNKHAALAHTEQGLKLAQVYDLGQIEGFILHRMGEVQTALEKYSDAVGYYKKAYDSNRFFGRTQFMIDNLEGIARLALISKDMDTALKNTEKILTYLNKHTLSGTEDSMRIYLTCAQVLRAADDERACDLINEAHDILQQQAENIEKKELRQSYLENVVVNQQIIQQYADCN